MTEAEIRERMGRYKFYHTIRLTDDITTPGWKTDGRLVEMTLRHLRTLDLKGKRVLDIGCRDGLFCFEAEKLGAAEVIGIDSDVSAGAVEFLIPFFGSRVRMHELNVFDLTPGTFGKFDVVLFPGVLYHLRYPVWALKLVRDVIADDGLLVLETAVLVDDNSRAMLFCPVGADSPYEPTSCTFYNTKGLADTLHSLGLAVQQTEYLNPQLHAAPVLTLKERLRALLGAPPAPRAPVVDRMTLVCRLAPEVLDARVTKYWDGTHHIHTRGGGEIYAASV